MKAKSLAESFIVPLQATKFDTSVVVEQKHNIEFHKYELQDGKRTDGPSVNTYHNVDPPRQQWHKISTRSNISDKRCVLLTAFIVS